MDCSSVKGNAPDGRSRADLCKETLECLRKTNCAKVQVIDCYCDREKSPDECRAGKAKGACAAALEAGLETTDPATVLQRLGDVNYGGGLATRRVDCNTFYCAAQCFQ